MASSTLTFYYDATHSQSFSLVSTGQNLSNWKVAGRDLSLPYEVSVQRKLTPPSALGNDHVIVTIRGVERNATTGKLVTGSVTMDISIPKDTATIGLNAMSQMVGYLSSLINDGGVLAGTNTNRTAILGGRDL